MRQQEHSLPRQPQSPYPLLLTHCGTWPIWFLLFQVHCISLQNSTGTLQRTLSSPTRWSPGKNRNLPSAA